jgi:methionine biosynthesis protein MetW
MYSNIVSPITQGEVNLVLEIEKKYIIETYKKELNVDTSYLFSGVDRIQLLECIKTGFRFFSPSSIVGDGNFYEHLEQIPWYYADWKWDYEEAIKYIPKQSSVLDIGCGEGKFLSYLRDNQQCEVTGLELNAKAIEIAKNNGLDVKAEMVEEHAAANTNKYDVVTFFQVLEHIEGVDQFLKNAIQCLKPGGQLLVAVPNNNPYFLTYDKYHLLNLPPHHMNWWNAKSLSALSSYYPIQLEKVINQPLGHFTGYTKSYLSNLFPKSKWLQQMLYPVCKVWFYLRRNQIEGASIMAVYRKSK